MENNNTNDVTKVVVIAGFIFGVGAGLGRFVVNGAINVTNNIVKKIRNRKNKDKDEEEEL